MVANTMATNTENRLIESVKKTPLFYKLLLILTMMTVIGGLLTGVMTYMNVGYSNTFFHDWSRALLAAFAIMPIGFLLMGLITTTINQMLPNTKAYKRNLITGVLMACIMESMLAFSTAAKTIGFADQAAFLNGWLQGFLVALPVGLTLMVIMSMTIKPKIEAFLKS
ncbi:DUF2798 domain-containing protein [Psychrobacter sp. NZS113]|uniref:DUF2798 domain-containing protein n=1 Tax=Psychrobacter sp. NZS113 TaxID=2792045 RepID=UPI0018CCBEBE|nr:DUF2798 domain-containing protein [Psychrobacter sp. NZS113]MBH0096542.1 DUF2798 domain-containing protein [Psychrobacter sp. NZS113]